MKSKRMKRRSFLKAAGAGASTISVGLPILDAMLDDNGYLVTPTYAQPSGAPVCLSSFFWPNGVPGNDRNGSFTWHPEGCGVGYTMSRNMRRLEPMRADILPVSGLPKECYHASRGSNAHTMGHATFNNAIATDSNGSGGGPSVEWIVSQEIGRDMRMPLLPLQLSDEQHEPVLFSNRSEQVDALRDPRDVFDRVFGDGPVDGPPGDPLAEPRRSVLDYVMNNITRLNSVVGVRDRQRLDQYFESVRQLEQAVSAEPGGECTLPERPQSGTNSSNEQLRLLIDLQVKAMECGVTRVSFLQLGGFGRQFIHLPEVGRVTSISMNGSGWHAISHDFRDKFDRVLDDVMEQAAYMLQKMKDVQWGDTNLLYNSVVFIASESESPSGGHKGENMPVVLAGNAGGQLQTGHAVCLNNGVYSQLFNNILGFFGLERYAAEGGGFGDQRYLEGGPLSLGV